MNYLAHAYLSFNQPEILVGNMISDYVKGKKQFDYSPEIHKGILLHRAIDHFTDTHPATKKAMEVFRPHYRLYSGAFIDVAFDHFLANDTDEFSSKAELSNFSKETYEILSRYVDIMPEQFKKMFPYMKEQDWLFNYHHFQGIEKSFGGLVRRAAYLSEHQNAVTIFHEHYTTLQKQYDTFFKDVKIFAIHHLQNLHK